MSASVRTSLLEYDAQMNCRCENPRHPNHLGGHCTALATEPDNYCKPCHDKAADEAMAAINVTVPPTVKPSALHHIKISKTADGEFEMKIDGEQIAASVMGFEGASKTPAVYIVIARSIDAVQRVAALSFEELSAVHITHVELPYKVDWFEALGRLRVTRLTEGQISLLFVFNLLSRWREPYTFAEYFDALSEHFPDTDKSSEAKSIGALMGEEHFSVPFTINEASPLKSEIARCENVFRGLHEKVIEKLQRAEKESLIVSFDFPEEIRVPCEQYLLYFGQFLADVGVKATTNIQHEAGQVLLSVTPQDKETALDKIHIALGEYLNLARAPVNEASIVSIAEQRLAANVDHLKGQLRLKNAELQLAHATIETQQVTIQVLRGDVLIESVKNVTPPQKSDDKESFLGETVALKPYNYKGVEVNYPEIFRKLKQLFKKDRD